jgi:hypothetical protein
MKPVDLLHALQAAILNHGEGPACPFLGRLKKQSNSFVLWYFMNILGQNLSGRQKSCHVPIMAAHVS